MNILLRYITFILIFALAPILYAKDNDANDIEAQKRKAHYTFMEAMRKKAIGEYDAYHELMIHAYALDTTNTAIAHHLGYSTLVAGVCDEAGLQQAIKLLESHFNSTPEDYYESYLLGNVCNKLRLTDKAFTVWNKLHELYPNKEDVMVNLADTYAHKKEFNKAIELYDTIESRNGVSIHTTLRKVNYRLASGDTLGTINEARQLLATAPQNVDYNLFIGNIFLQLGQRDSAMSYFDEAHKIDPDNGYAYLYKADYYRAQGDSINYDKQTYNALINQNLVVEQKVEILVEYVRDAFNEGIQQSERTENLFAALIEQHPHESAIHDLYSQYLATIKDYKGAAEQLGYVLDMNPSDAENWKKLVLLHLVDENYEGVFEAADKAMEYNSDNSNLYKYLASAYHQIKEYDKAIDTYNIAFAKADSTDFVELSEIIASMGDVYYSKGDTLACFAQYEKAIDYNPGNLMAMNNYAYFLAVNERDLDKAEKMSSTTVKYEPENPTFLDTYAWIFFKKGEYNLALTYMKAAIEHSEKQGEDPSAELYEHYGDALFMNGQHEQAVTYWEKALKLSPDSDLLQRKVKHKTFFFK